MMFWLGVGAAYAFLGMLLVAWLVGNRLLAAIDEGYVAITKHVGIIRQDVLEEDVLENPVYQPDVRLSLRITPSWRVLWVRFNRRTRRRGVA